MLYLHKILPAFFLPISLVIIFIFIGLKMNSKKIINITLILLYLLSTPLFSKFLFKIVEGREYKIPINNIKKSDAIVVLSGMLEIIEKNDSTYIEWGDPDRFFGGIELFKANKSDKLIFTGAKMPWDKLKKSEGDVLKEYAILYGIPAENIYITKIVGNTEDEAMATRELIKPCKNIILITSAYHMYRAKMLFEKQGFNVIPYKVDYKTMSDRKITILDFIPSSNYLAITEVCVKEILGIIFYSIRNLF